MSLPTTGKYLSKLLDKRVLVLGGTSGIGFSIAEAALEHGADVVVSSSNPSRVAAAVDRLRAGNPAARVRGYVCDLSDTANIETNLSALLARAAAADDDGGQRLNHVAVTAGDVVAGCGLADLEVEAVHAAMAVRFVSVAVLAKVLPRYMDLSVGNSLTLTSGAAVEKPLPGVAVMAGVGGAVEGLARGLAVDLKPLRVNVVAPGPVHTERFHQRFHDGNAVLEMMKAKTITGEVARPEDAAEAYLYAMKGRSVTGTVIKTNGGWLLA